MDFSLNEDHLALREAVQRFCKDVYPAQNRGNSETQEQASARWRGLAELGLLGLPLPAKYGGSEQGAIEVMIAAQEFGRALGGGAYIPGIILAAQLLLRLGNAQQHELLSAVASGESQVALALYEEGQRYDWRACATHATAVTDGYRLEGGKSLVLHADTADRFLVLAHLATATGDGLALFLVDAKVTGLKLKHFSTLDGRSAAHLEFSGVVLASSALVGVPGQCSDALEAVLDTTVAALCAEATGATDALLELTAEHLRTRKQFGAPLAKFQALQHQFADMVIGLEQLKSMACAAAMAQIDGSDEQRKHLSSAAKVLTGQLGRQIGLAAIQLHGAMGMTDECRVGHYVKRLMVIGQLFGDSHTHLQRLVKPI